MVTFCLLGSGAKIEDKVVFDPDRSKRRVLYDEVCALFPDYVVYIGGSSSFDFAPKQYNKYDSILKYASEHGYTLEDILFIGDDFADGGGDSHVRIKGMDYVQIEDYTQTPEMLAFLLD
jgi:hydroxymethylpyrimidine pyrophosphatase-like HAD family hydrolase